MAHTWYIFRFPELVASGDPTRWFGVVVPVSSVGVLTRIGKSKQKNGSNFLPKKIKLNNLKKNNLEKLTNIKMCFCLLIFWSWNFFSIWHFCISQGSILQKESEYRGPREPPSHVHRETKGHVTNGCYLCQLSVCTNIMLFLMT